ncbi:MAG: polyprenyl diphosphate synthase [Planctomycetota bacterium]|nr:polyprenyl diphosphate synthase [Planctomycetota bacterium]MDA1112772.1 polyprenyl diphosphate synthase [Planctomycetota bacterium]
MDLKPDFPVPRHVGVIMDGNGRWARRTGLMRLRGHEAGVEAVRDTVEAAAEWGIEHLTLYAFSVENWQRPRLEVEGLMKFLANFLATEKAGLIKNRIRLQGLGRLEDLPAKVVDALADVQEATKEGDRMTLRLALSYGGRQEILDGVQKILADVQEGKLKAAHVDLSTIAASLYDPAMPDPDLIIRSAGEIRLSNFLLWQASYSEFHFTDVLWPDFRREQLLLALRDYHSRVRRFGKVLDRDPAVEKTS